MIRGQGRRDRRPGTDLGSAGLVDISPSAIAAATDFCRSLERACRESRMYPVNHPTLESGLQQLVAAADRALDAVVPVRLVISESEIRCSNEVVYTGAIGTDNLAFVLFRDGVREIMLYPGIQRDELEQLVDVVAHVDALDRWDHDLVTMLWEADFLHIDYAVADPLVGGTGISREVVDSLRDVVLRRLAELEHAGGDPVAPHDVPTLMAMLEQPTPEAVVGEITEDPCPLDDLHLFLAELLDTCASGDTAGMLVRALTTEIGGRIERGDLATARSLVDRIRNAAAHNPVAAEAVRAWDPTGPEYRAAIRRLVVEANAVPGTGPGAEHETSILNDPSLRPVLLPALLELLVEERDRSVRRSILALLTARRDLPSRLVTPYLNDGRWYVVRNMVQLLAFSPDAQPLPDLRNTVHYPDERVRREAIRTLERMGAAGRDPSALLRLFLRDPDPEVRTLAARAIGPQAGEPGMSELLAQVERPDFPTRSKDEVEAMMGAVTRLATAGHLRARAIKALNELWKPRFWRNHPTVVRVAALRALATIGGPEATAALRSAASSRDAGVRAPALALLRAPSSRVPEP